MNDLLPAPDMEEFPPWREALKKFLALGLVEGDLVKKSWLYEAFGIAEPTRAMAHGPAEKLELAFLQQMKPFRDALKVERRIYLVPCWGQGYLWLPASEQGAHAFEKGLGALDKALRDMTTGVGTVNYGNLDSAERARQADVEAKTAHLVQMCQPRKRLSLYDGPGPGPGKESACQDRTRQDEARQERTRRDGT